MIAFFWPFTVNITDIPPQLGLLQKMWTLNASGCSLSEPLKGMFENKQYKTADILGYLKSSLERCQPYTRMKLMLVGLENKGKTSLLRAVRNFQRFDLSLERVSLQFQSLIDWLGIWLIDRSTDWLIDRLIDWLIVRLIDWLIVWLFGRLIDWLTDWLIDWLIRFIILLCWVVDWVDMMIF